MSTSLLLSTGTGQPNILARDSLVMESNVCYRSWWWVGSAVLRVNKISGMARLDLNKTYSFIMKSFFCYLLHLINPLIVGFLLETSSANWGCRGLEVGRSISSLAAAAAPTCPRWGNWWVGGKRCFVTDEAQLCHSQALPRPVQDWEAAHPSKVSTLLISISNLCTPRSAMRKSLTKL